MSFKAFEEIELDLLRTMTELGTADSGLLQVYSEDSEPESFTSASYDEEGGLFSY